jgi:hypothetical protein
VIAAAGIASSTSTLANGEFYQAAAALFGVLLLTGVVAEVRASRPPAGAPDADAWTRRSLGGFLALSVVVLTGELAALTVLLRQEAPAALQFIIGVALILGLVGVPGLVFLGVARDVVGGEAVVRWVRSAAITGAAIAAVVVAAFLLPAAFTGSPGVGIPNTSRSEHVESPAANSRVAAEARQAPAGGPESCLASRPPAENKALASELEALWFGAGGVGSEIAGCPGIVHVQHDPTVAWVLGVHAATGTVVSLGVAGTTRPALLLGDAARIGRELLRQGELLGASQRVKAGSGDLYVLYTRQGAGVLLRHELGHGGQEMPYMFLPPTVTVAWLAAMREQRRWLWITAVTGNAGQRAYVFRPVGGGAAVDVQYTVATGLAMRARYVYRVPTAPLNIEELESLLPS